MNACRKEKGQGLGTSLKEPQILQNCGMSSFVAVHVGAGRHSHKNEDQMNEACSNACMAAMKILREGGLVLDAVQAAVVVLEDHPLTNAGHGSSLSCDGLVECDASIMCGLAGRYGCVGACPSK